MASPNKRKKLEAAFSGAEEEKPEVPDLEKPEVQHDIMDPAGTELELSIGSVRTFPLTMLMRRRVNGFIRRVGADALGSGIRSAEEFGLRTLSLVLSSPVLEQEMFRLFAVSMHSPGSVTEHDDKLTPFVKNLADNCNEDDSTLIYGRLAQLAKSSPKQRATAP